MLTGRNIKHSQCNISVTQLKILGHSDINVRLLVVKCLHEKKQRPNAGAHFKTETGS